TYHRKKAKAQARPERTANSLVPAWSGTRPPAPALGRRRFRAGRTLGLAQHRRSAAALRPQREDDRARRASQQEHGDRAPQRDHRIAARDRHCLAERLLDDMAEDQPEDERRLRNVELAERIAEHAEAERHVEVERVAVERIDAG